MTAEFDDLPVFAGFGLGHGSVWRLHAACRGLPADPFFEERGGQARDAEVVCASCPVRLDCLQEAVLGPPVLFDHGIWGGTSERHRRVLRRELSRCPHPESFYGPEDCRCRFCRGLVQLDDRMAAIRRGEDPPVFDGVEGTARSHGRAATYAAGCRCQACGDALREQRQRLRARREAARAEADDQGVA